MSGRDRRGFSLVELLVAICFLGLFTITVQQFARTMLRGVRVLEVASEAQEAARLGVQLVVADLREAGYSPTAALGNGVRRAAPEAVELVRDLNGDGDTDDSNERVGYQYAADRRALLRSQGAAAPQPLLNDVPAEGVLFTYLGGDGTPLSGASELDDAQRARVRRVGVRLRLEIRHPDPAYARPIRAEQQAVASLRNGAPE